ncbi:hypothetical protein CBR_g36781 [Chara braunii]|uniref:Uncharacterized protein n=1 Tax=Chara braunii TaxID=69332 RepID=A0A388LLR7_CHABU|nr:hypothetical protein CBR_g36781 [Chara braunii]|eukprot:GBG83165.1 hypothetical protein CBR_g36781 [Chara braunii]
MAHLDIGIPRYRYGPSPYRYPSISGARICGKYATWQVRDVASAASPYSLAWQSHVASAEVATPRWRWERDGNAQVATPYGVLATWRWERDGNAEVATPRGDESGMATPRWRCDREPDREAKVATGAGSGSESGGGDGYHTSHVPNIARGALSASPHGVLAPSSSPTWQVRRWRRERDGDAEVVTPSRRRGGVLAPSSSPTGKCGGGDGSGRAWDREQDWKAKVATQGAGSVAGSGSGGGDAKVATQGTGSGSGIEGGDGSGTGIGKRRCRSVPHFARAKHRTWRTFHITSGCGQVTK